MVKILCSILIFLKCMFSVGFLPHETTVQETNLKVHFVVVLQRGVWLIDILDK